MTIEEMLKEEKKKAADAWFGNNGNEGSDMDFGAGFDAGYLIAKKDSSLRRCWECGNHIGTGSGLEMYHKNEKQSEALRIAVEKLENILAEADEALIKIKEVLS
jgi:hypothetical protein